MKDLEDVKRRITELKAQLENLQGTRTEVYSRIVGYYRPVDNWNKGKREEFNLRTPFHPPEPGAFERPGGRRHETAERDSGVTEAAGYIYFFRASCPNCPPVAEAVHTLPLPGEKISVDSDAGLRKARDYHVLAAPTVLFLTRDGKEVFRVSTPDAVRKAAETLSSVGVAV